MLRRGCVFGAFQGAERDPTQALRRSHFHSKSIKMASKRHAKIYAEKVLKIDAKKAAKMMPQWLPNSSIFHTFSKKSKNEKSRSRCSGSTILHVQGT